MISRFRGRLAKGGGMHLFFWEFLFYSFTGYLLEKWFARQTRSEKKTRKGLILLPLCPVYGLGMTAVLVLPLPLRSFPWLILSGAVVTTAVEYVFHWACETFLHVKFWDYTGILGNLRGRVSLRFTLIWGALVAMALWICQPFLISLIPRIPAWVTFAGIMVLTLDVVYSVWLLSVTHDPESLHLRTLRSLTIKNQNADAA